ncbi:MAG: DUF3570 domain-containing protein [Sulfurovum sp.]|nr:DUF3570 domain-containing protein [Sulfurovum sp.]
MQIIKSFLLGIMLMIPFLKAYASELQDSASFGFDTYTDNNDVQVYSPTFSLMKTLSKNWLVGVKLRVDAIAAASIRIGGSPAQVDAQATASKQSGFDDVRASPTFLVAYEKGEHSASAGIYYSNEVDYIGQAFFASYTRELNQGNTVLGIGFSQSGDTWSPSNNRQLEVANRDEQKIDFSFNQLLSPTASVQLVYSYMHSEGLLSSPYPYLVQDDTFIGFEKYPKQREGHAFALKGLKYIDEDNSLNFSYRYYKDDWDINSHTLSAEWLHDVNEQWMVGARIRYYSQTGSNFAKDIGTYTTNDPYVVVDYRMSAFDSYNFGIPLTYTPSDSPYSFSLSVDYYQTSDNNYIQQWFGESNIQAVYTTFRVDYTF